MSDERPSGMVIKPMLELAEGSIPPGDFAWLGPVRGARQLACISDKLPPYAVVYQCEHGTLAVPVMLAIPTSPVQVVSSMPSPLVQS